MEPGKANKFTGNHLCYHLMLEFAFGFLSSTIHSEVTKLWVAKIFAYCKKNSQQLLHLSQIFAHQNKDMKNLLGVTFPVREKLNI